MCSETCSAIIIILVFLFLYFIDNYRISPSFIKNALELKKEHMQIPQPPDVQTSTTTPRPPPPKMKMAYDFNAWPPTGYYESGFARNP